MEVVIHALTGVWMTHGAVSQPCLEASASRPPPVMMASVARSAPGGSSTSQAPATSVIE